MGQGAAAAKAFPESVALLCATLSPPSRARFAPALERLDWTIRLPSRAAPGFVYLAGALGGVAVGGGGGDLDAAAARLAGEASEALAQAAQQDPCALPMAASLAATWGEGPRIAALRLTDGRQVGAPASSISTGLAGLAGAPPRSLGLAAGPDRDAARLAGLLELIERDAAARWWNGEGRARAVCAGDVVTAAADLEAMRAGAQGLRRPTSLLALGAAGGTPVVAALSSDPDGRGGLAFGLKAALDARDAAAGAVRELLQMEIALEIARLRVAQGEDRAADAGALRRAALDPDDFAAFAAAPARGSGPAPSDLADLVARLAAVGVEPIVADLGGAPRGIAVAKAFAPGLRPLPGPAGALWPGAPGAAAELM